MERKGYGGGFGSPISDGERKAALAVGRNRRKEKGKGRRSLTGGTDLSAARCGTRPRARRRASSRDLGSAQEEDAGAGKKERTGRTHWAVKKIGPRAERE
jgi:hypothetical protein